MADAVPIRPDMPISIASDTMRFCADAVAEFLTNHSDEPVTAILILFDRDGKPTIDFTGASASNLCLVGALLQRHAVDTVTGARDAPNI